MFKSSKEPEPVSSMSGMSEIVTCLLSPIVDDPSALPSATSSPSSSVTLLSLSLDASPCVPALYCPTLLFKVLYYKIKNVSFVLCVRLFVHYCVKCIINLLHYSTI